MEKKIILNADEMKEYKNKKIKSLRYNETYIEFLKYIEKKIFNAIDKNPCISNVHISIPDSINGNIICDILTDDYGYKVKNNPNYIIIILED